VAKQQASNIPFQRDTFTDTPMTHSHDQIQPLLSLHIVATGRATKSVEEERGSDDANPEKVMKGGMFRYTLARDKARAFHVAALAFT
jgi:hypothetical protein